MRTPGDEERPEMRQRCLVSVRSRDGDGEAVRRHPAGERDLASDRRAYGRGVVQGDVDAPVLTPGIRVVSERELTKNRPVRRPNPARGRWSGDWAANERPQGGSENGRQESGDQRLRCPQS
jgi:hypothetical protein